MRTGHHAKFTGLFTDPAAGTKTGSVIFRFPTQLQSNQHMLGQLQTLLFPPTCLLCGAAGNDGQNLCSGCHADLPYNRHACRRCAIPLPIDRIECGRCQQQPPPFDLTIAPLYYQPPVDYLVKSLKFHGRLSSARVLSELLAAAVAQRQETLPDCIVPVPIHRIRLGLRGFNQAIELARPLSSRLGIPLAPRCVRRIRHIPRQASLSASARRLNVRGAFAIGQPITARHVAILDDVVTTGSTVAEIARILRKAGVEKIEIWICARTVY